MKNILLIILLCVSFSSFSRGYDIVKNECLLELRRSSDSTILTSLNLDVITWQNTSSEYGFQVDDGISSFSANINHISNFTSVDSLFTLLMTWKLSCQTGSNVRLNGDTLIVGSDTVIITGGGAQTLTLLTKNDTSQSISISGGNTIALDIRDLDSDATNEIQTLSKSNDTIYLEDGGFVVLDRTITDTYANISALKYSNRLINGFNYVISDYQTIYDLLDFDSTGTIKSSLTTLYGSIEPLVLTATSNNTFAPSVWSLAYPADEIVYNIDIDTTAVNGSAAKGAILKRVDENNNTTFYDHRNVKFIRYNNGSGVYNEWKDNGNSTDTLLTFNAAAVNNYIGNVQYLQPSGIENQRYNNIVFIGVSVNNIIETGNRNQTFENAYGNILRDGNVDITTSGLFVYNNIGNANSDVTFGNDCFNNDIGNNNVLLSFGNNSTNNIIGDNNSNISIGNNSSFNELHGLCSNISIGNNSTFNELHGLCSNVFIGNNCFTNTLHRLGTNIFIDSLSAGNHIYQGCDSISIGFSSNDNQFFENCDNIVLGDSSQMNNFIGGISNLNWATAHTDLTGLKYNTFNFAPIDGSTWVNRITKALHPMLYEDTQCDIILGSDGNAYVKYFNGITVVYTIID